MQKISGKVVDINGAPLSDVNINIKENPTKGAITNSFGQFYLSANAGETLFVSYVGKAPQEIKVVAGQFLVPNIVMMDSFELEGVTVTGTPGKKTNYWPWFLLAAGATYLFTRKKGKTKGLNKAKTVKKAKKQPKKVIL
jgi:hypothetical protein